MTIGWRTRPRRSRLAMFSLRRREIPRFARNDGFVLVSPPEQDREIRSMEKNMAVKVIIPTPLRVYAAKNDSAEVSAQTVGEALSGLTTQHAELRKHLFTE